MADTLVAYAPEIYDIAMDKLRPMMDKNQKGYMIVDSTLPTDLPRSKKRLRAAYEGPENRKKKKKMQKRRLLSIEDRMERSGVITDGVSRRFGLRFGRFWRFVRFGLRFWRFGRFWRFVRFAESHES